MRVDPAIFKAYDIRGIYPEQLNEELAYAIGLAFAVWLERQGAGHPAVVVGRDGRISGLPLTERVVAGILDQGRDVIDIGMVSSDQFYFACATNQSPGVMVTASHNPKEYNGMKLVKEIPFFLSKEAGISEIQTIIESGAFPDVPRKGSIRHSDIRAGYVAKLRSLVAAEQIQPLTVAADTANGVAGPALEEVASSLPIRLHHLYPEVDGTFPNHSPDPLRPESTVALSQEILRHTADVGFAFDGDGDRCFALDEKGEFIPSEFLGALIARFFLEKLPGSAFLYDARCSWAFPNAVEAAGGRAIMTRVGHAYIKPRMMKEGALYGIEVSGHHYFKDFYYCDSGMLFILYALQVMSACGRPLSALVSEFRAKYHLSGELNFRVKDAASVMARLKEQYMDAPKHYELDGVSFEYPDWHFNVRSSNTEPLLRLNLESIVSKEHMGEKLKEVEAIISQ